MTLTWIFVGFGALLLAVVGYDLIQRKHAIPSRHIFLMPEGTDSETISARERMLTSLCMEHGFRLSDRLHIHLFGDTRGT